mmetsp:Transcript_156544/g.502434  ORF Transcript_156544/g.502434 Transcript_156544/m.502434 type:complete len:387 (-) Transcript_156544:2320-3480(-)
MSASSSSWFQRSKPRRWNSAQASDRCSSTKRRFPSGRRATGRAVTESGGCPGSSGRKAKMSAAASSGTPTAASKPSNKATAASLSAAAPSLLPSVGESSSNLSRPPVPRARAQRRRPDGSAEGLSELKSHHTAGERFRRSTNATIFPFSVTTATAQTTSPAASGAASSTRAVWPSPPSSLPEAGPSGGGASPAVQAQKQEPGPDPVPVATSTPNSMQPASSTMRTPGLASARSGPLGPPARASAGVARARKRPRTEKRSLSASGSPSGPSSISACSAPSLRTLHSPPEDAPMSSSKSGVTGCFLSSTRSCGSSSWQTSHSGFSGSTQSPCMTPFLKKIPRCLSAFTSSPTTSPLAIGSNRCSTFPPPCREAWPSRRLLEELRRRPQ